DPADDGCVAILSQAAAGRLWPGAHSTAGERGAPVRRRHRRAARALGRRNRGNAWSGWLGVPTADGADRRRLSQADGRLARRDALAEAPDQPAAFRCRCAAAGDGADATPISGPLRARTLRWIGGARGAAAGASALW